MGGLERVLIEVLQTIDREKYDIYLIIEDDCGEENIFEKDIPEGMKYFFLKPEPLINYVKKIKNKKKNIFFKLFYNLLMNIEAVVCYINLEKILKKIGRVDVFIDYDTGASKYIEKLKVNKKVAWIHNSIPNLMKKQSKIKRYGKRLEKYDGVVAICEEMKNEIELIYPKLKEKVYKIYNPFNFKRILELGEDRSNLSQDDKKLLEEDYFIAVSRLDTRQKDYFTLIEAFKILKERGVKEKLYIVGDGVSREEIQCYVKELNLIDQIIFLGQRKNPYVWMKNSKAFIHSSKFEGFGLVLVEAQILGKLVISSNCPVGPREILGNGEYGIIFDVGNSVHLANEMEKILKDNLLRKEYEKKSLERANSFRSDKILKEYEKLIDKVGE